MRNRFHKPILRKRIRISPLILGVIIGLVFGVSIAMWSTLLRPGIKQFGHWVSGLFSDDENSYKSADSKDNDSTLVVVRTDNRIPPGTNLPLRPDSATYMALWFDFSSRPGYGSLDSLTLDSFILARYYEGIADSSLTLGQNDLVIKEDQMAGIKQIRIIGSQKQNSSATDSLVNNINRNDRQIARVEFWRSPVNFSGYKRQGSNIVLYGIDMSEEIILIMHENGLYLLSKSVFYCLFSTGDFEPYIAEKNKALIEALNQKIAQSQQDSRRI